MIKSLVLISILSTNLFTLSGCQSVQEKNQEHVRDRIGKLKGLSSWQSKICHVKAMLTQPARARYKEMFPKDKLLKSDLPMEYTWRVSESRCEIEGAISSPLIESNKSLLNTAFCVLLQTHYVNSPFDELKASKDDLLKVEDQVQIRTNEDPKVGIFLDTKKFTVETRTANQRSFLAEYNLIGSQWLPSRIETRSGKALIVIDSITYSEAPVGGRSMVETYTLGIGEDQVLPHTTIEISDCKND